MKVTITFVYPNFSVSVSIPDAPDYITQSALAKEYALECIQEAAEEQPDEYNLWVESFTSTKE